MSTIDGLLQNAEAYEHGFDKAGAAADAVPRLEDDDVGARLGETISGREAGDPGADDERVYQFPPSATVIASPLMPLASSLARNATVLATSSTATTRPAG
jgi:hypothetical protein